MKMAKWLLVSHYFVVSALAASEAQLKFVPVPIDKRPQLKGTVEPVRSTPSASSHHTTVVPISNSSIRVNTHDITGISHTGRGFHRAIHSDSSHDPGRLHASASYQQPHRGDRSYQRYGQDYQSVHNTLDEHSRNFRGLQTPRVDVDLHGSHYQGPAYRHHQGQPNNYRENRVEVRIDDFRRDQTQRFQSFQNRPQDFHRGPHGSFHGSTLGSPLGSSIGSPLRSPLGSSLGSPLRSQRPFDTDVRGSEWQQDRDYRPQDRDYRPQDRDYRPQDRDHRTQDRDHRTQDRDYGQQDRDFRQQDRDYRQPGGFGDRRDDTRQSFRPDEGQSQSCGPQSPCLEPNGLFPVDGNCCGFVNCANCRPYTQRCAAGTVFDLDLWICNHERDTRQCAGNNRECAFQAVNLRGQSQDDEHQEEGSSQRGFDASSGGSSGGPSGWEYASASEVKEVKKKTGKVSRVKKIAKSSKA